MKRASHILLTVSGGLSIALAVTFLSCAILMYLMGGSPVFADFLREAAAKTDAKPEDIELAIKALSLVYLGLGSMFSVLFVMAIFSSIFSFKAAYNPTRPLLITAMVFGFLSGSEVGAVGGILGLIVNSRES